MRKTPKKQTPVRQVRVGTGFGQKEFADLVGIKYDLYQSLELGRASLTEENALRIFDHTGALPGTLDHNSSTVALAADGKPYSKEAWEAWNRYLGKEDLHWVQTTHMLKWTHFLCDVARKQGRLRQTQRALARALKTVATDCGLEPAIKLELSKIKVKWDSDYTYGQLRNSKLLADAVGFKDRTHKGGIPIPDEEKWECTFRASLRWDPFGFCAEEITDRLKPL
jgi:hypothetical protein